MGREYDRIRVDNLLEFRDDLRDVSQALPGVLRKAHKELADFVVGRAETRAQQTSKQAARAAEGLSTSAGQLTSTIRLSADKVPGAFGSEFGAAHDSERILRPHPGSRSWSTRTRMAGWNQFPMWTGNGGTAGVFLFPTIRDTQQEQVALYDEMLAGIMAGAFPD